ncbi:MAG: MFS transporter, partial [Candidatus Binataceae bacterium]
MIGDSRQHSNNAMVGVLAIARTLGAAGAPRITPQRRIASMVKRNTKNRTIIYAAAFLRAMAIGLMGVLLGLYLAQLRFTPAMIGVVIAAGLAGGAVAALIATVAADRLGRRRFLFALAFISAAGGLAIVFAAATPVIVTAAAFAGMVNGMGKDRGAALVVEQAILPVTASASGRTQAFAMYNVAQAIGAALGGLIAGMPGLLHRVAGMSPDAAMQIAMLVYSALMLLTAFLYPALGAETEARDTPAQFTVSPPSRRVITRLCALFAIDAVGGGFYTEALLAFFFVERFGASTEAVALLFFGAYVTNALSQFFAAWLARRIGLINTMVFTHIPANLLLIAVAFSPNFIVAAILYLLRELMQQMDVPTRQSYVMAVV